MLYNFLKILINVYIKKTLKLGLYFHKIITFMIFILFHAFIMSCWCLSVLIYALRTFLLSFNYFLKVALITK